MSAWRQTAMETRAARPHAHLALHVEVHGEVAAARELTQLDDRREVLLLPKDLAIRAHRDRVRVLELLVPIGTLEVGADHTDVAARRERGALEQDGRRIEPEAGGVGGGRVQKEARGRREGGRRRRARCRQRFA